jgi:hypothetical protein
MLYYDEKTHVNKLLSILGSEKQQSAYESPLSDEIIDNDFSFDILLLKMILNSELSDNPYKIDFLEGKLADYRAKKC